jgi:branched-chain amino acid transport system substrate-binding protein
MTKEKLSNFSIIRRRVLGGMVGGATLATFGFPIISSAQTASVKIGFLLPFTGDFAESGNAIRDAVDMAIEEINDAGGLSGLGGAKIVPVYANSTSVDEANTETNRLISSEGVIAIVGAYSSGATISSTVIAERARIPYLVPNALADEITQRGLSYVFKTVPNFSQYAINSAQMAKDLSASAGVPLKRVALVRQNDFFGNVVGREFAAHLPVAELDLIRDNVYPKNPTSFEDIIISLKRDDPDVVFAAGEPASITLLFQQLRELRYWPKVGWIGVGGGYTNPATHRNLGQLAEGLVVVNDWFPQINRPGAEEINERYRARTDKDMLGNANTTYAGVFILADALNRAGSTDGEMIRNALRETDMTEGVPAFMYERVTFDENGMMPGSILVGAQITDGRARVIWPETYKVEEPVWPTPAPR